MSQAISPRPCRRRRASGSDHERRERRQAGRDRREPATRPPAFSSVLDRPRGPDRTCGRPAQDHRRFRRSPLRPWARSRQGSSLAQVGERRHRPTGGQATSRRERHAAYARRAGRHAFGRADAAGAGRHDHRCRNRGCEHGGNACSAVGFGPWRHRAGAGRRQRSDQQLHPRHRQAGTGTRRSRDTGRRATAADQIEAADQQSAADGTAAHGRGGDRRGAVARRGDRPELDRAADRPADRAATGNGRSARQRSRDHSVRPGRRANCEAQRQDRRPRRHARRRADRRPHHDVRHRAAAGPDAGTQDAGQNGSGGQPQPSPAQASLHAPAADAQSQPEQAAPAQAANATAPTPGLTAVPTPQAAPTAPTAATAAATGPARYGVGLSEAVETVKTTIELGSRQGFSQAKIQLAPASLGQITIHLQKTSDGIVAKVVADHSAAAQTMQQGGDDLRRSLQNSGLHLLRLDIETRGDQRGSANGSAHDLPVGPDRRRQRHRFGRQRRSFPAHDHRAAKRRTRERARLTGTQQTRKRPMSTVTPATGTTTTAQSSSTHEHLGDELAAGQGPVPAADDGRAQEPEPDEPELERPDAVRHRARAVHRARAADQHRAVDRAERSGQTRPARRWRCSATRSATSTPSGQQRHRRGAEGRLHDLRADPHRQRRHRHRRRLASARSPDRAGSKFS